MTIYYEDIEAGQTVSFGSYRLEKDEMLAFATKWDPRPFHVDEEHARQTIYGSLTASGVQTMAVYTKLCCQGTDDWAVSGALGYEQLSFPRAVRPGDLLSARSEILSKRLSASRPEFGIVRSRDTLTNQNGELVLDLVVAYLMGRRPAS